MQRWLGALPREGGFLESAGRQVTGADRAVQGSAVTPHHSGPGIAVDLSEQGPAQSLFPQSRVTGGSLTAEPSTGNVELDRFLDRLGVTTEPMIRR